MIVPAFSVAPLSPAELARARSYLYGGLAFGVVAELWLLSLLWLAWATGASESLARRWSAWRRQWMRDAALGAALAGYVLLGMLPLSFGLDYLRESHYGFAAPGAGAWLLQWLESSLVTVLAAAVVIAVAYAWMRRGSQPRRGFPSWLRIWVVLSAGVVIAVAADPVLIQPLFNRFTPIQNPAIRQEIRQLAVKAGIPRAAIYEMNASRQSSHTNAFVVGILGSRRIVVYDTLLRDQTPAEIAFVVGHEIGHYVLHHLWKGVAFTLAYLFALCALLGWLLPRFSRGARLGDIAVLPLALLILLGLVYLTAPVTNGFSRWEEHQADAYGLKLTGDGCAAVASFEREERTDLIYPDPPALVVWWFYNHPSQRQRIDFAARYCGRSRPGAAIARKP